MDDGRCSGPFYMCVGYRGDKGLSGRSVPERYAVNRVFIETWARA